MNNLAELWPLRRVRRKPLGEAEQRRDRSCPVTSLSEGKGAEVEAVRPFPGLSQSSRQETLVAETSGQRSSADIDDVH